MVRLGHNISLSWHSVSIGIQVLGCTPSGSPPPFANSLSATVLYHGFSVYGIECEARHHVPMMANNFTATRHRGGVMPLIIIFDRLWRQVCESVHLTRVRRKHKLPSRHRRPKWDVGFYSATEQTLGNSRLRPILRIGDRRSALLSRVY